MEQSSLVCWKPSHESLWQDMVHYYKESCLGVGVFFVSSLTVCVCFVCFCLFCFAFVLFCLVSFVLFVWLFVCLFFIFYWHGLDMLLWCLMLTDVVCFCWLIVPYRNIIHSVLTLGFISWVWLILARIFGLGILLSLFEQGNPWAIHRTSIFMMILFDTSSNQVCQKKKEKHQLEVQDQHRSTNWNKGKLLYHCYVQKSSHFED